MASYFVVQGCERNMKKCCNYKCSNPIHHQTVPGAPPENKYEEGITSGLLNLAISEGRSQVIAEGRRAISALEFLDGAANSEEKAVISELIKRVNVAINDLNIAHEAAIDAAIPDSDFVVS